MSPAEFTRSRQTRTLLCVTLLTCVTAGCGGAQQGLFAPISLHATTCNKLGQQRAAEIKRERYIPNEVIIHRWPGRKPTKPEVVTESELARRLASRGPRGTLLIARGGTGKSKLAWSLEAQTCDAMPVVRVDLRWDVKVRPKDAPGEPVFRAVVEALGAAPSGPLETLKNSLKGRRWLLLLDSLDEVPLGERKVLVSHINAAMERSPELRIVVFTRPPVFSGTYGLQHAEAMVELPQLACARTEQLRRKMLKTPQSQASFARFVERYGLDRKATTDTGRCYYPHLGTYRDFFVLKRLAEAEAEAASLESRASVYLHYLGVTLKRDMQGFDFSAAQAVATLDRIIAANKPGAGVRNLAFSVKDCQQHVQLKDSQRAAAVCERLLQSSLFKRNKDSFRLRNQTLSDLFMARYADAHLSDDGCAKMSEASSLFESNEVAGFLVGMPKGRRCIRAVTTALCQHSGFAQHNFEQLDQGLPGGAERLKLLRAASEATGQASNLCVSSTLERLSRAARGAKEATPSEAPAPGAPGT